MGCDISSVINDSTESHNEKESNAKEGINMDGFFRNNSEVLFFILIFLCLFLDNKSDIRGIDKC